MTRTIRPQDYADAGILIGTRSNMQIHAYADIGDSINAAIEMGALTVGEAARVCEDLGLILRRRERESGRGE